MPPPPPDRTIVTNTHHTHIINNYTGCGATHQISDWQNVIFTGHFHRHLHASLSAPTNWFEKRSCFVSRERMFVCVCLTRLSGVFLFFHGLENAERPFVSHLVMWLRISRCAEVACNIVAHVSALTTSAYYPYRSE